MSCSSRPARRGHLWARAGGAAAPRPRLLVSPDLARMSQLRMVRRAGKPAGNDSSAMSGVVVGSGDAGAQLGAQAEVRPAVYKAVAVACLGSFLFGYHLGIVNGPLGQIATDLGFSNNLSLQGLVVSISLAGAAVGSLSGTVLADLLGRVKGFQVDALPLLAGAYLCSSAASPDALLAGRFLVGVGIGLSSALVPLYITEVVPGRVRGAFGSLNQVMICVGILGALLVNVALPGTSWRTMFGLSAVPAALLGAGMLLRRETPAYLQSKGQREAAVTAAEELWGAGGLQELYGSTGGSAADGGSSKPGSAAPERGLFEGINARLTATACVLFVIQQFSGINAIVYFSSSVFRDAGVGSEALASAAVGLVNVLGSLAAVFLMDRQGRKSLLRLSLIGQGASMVVMALVLGNPALSGVAGPVALVFTLLYVLMFALGTGPVPGVMCGELLPTNIRGRGVSMALGTHWVCNFMLGQLFLSAVGVLGVSGVYYFFAAICALGALFVNSFLIETKGQTPEEIASQLT